MKRAYIFGWCMALAVGVSVRGFAQMEGAVPGDSDIRIVSSFVASGDPVPAACREEAAILARTLSQYRQAEAWHWVVICDEAGWRRFLRLSGRPDEERILASTDLEARTTYLRGAKMLSSEDLRVTPDRVIAHEVAHIHLHSGDEAEAESLARCLGMSGDRRPGICCGNRVR